MRFIALFILNIFDKIYQKKIINKLKFLLNKKINVVFDVGSHKGETLQILLKNFEVENIYSFEPSLINYQNLLKKNKIKNPDTKIIFFNYGLGEKNEKKKFKQMKESSSSTLSKINEKTKYFKRKNLIINYGFKNDYYEETLVEIKKGISIVQEEKIKNIDFLKIDTEGHELYILKGFENFMTNIGVILFEHHYDLMLNKGYGFSDINSYLIECNFKMFAKFKMPFRKSFEYIYINENKY